MHILIYLAGLKHVSVTKKCKATVLEPDLL